MTTQPQALALADELDASATEWRNEIDTRKQAAALLRTQHAEIERKDALLRQALEEMGKFSVQDICQSLHHKKSDQHSAIEHCKVAERFQGVWHAIKQELSQ